MSGSTPLGIVTSPLGPLLRSASRLRFVLMHNRPSYRVEPKPPAWGVLPWARMQDTFGGRLVIVSTSWSLLTEVWPEPYMRPPMPSELAQPDWAPIGVLLEHGQSGPPLPEPSPKQYGVPPLSSHSSG